MKEYMKTRFQMNVFTRRFFVIAALTALVLWLGAMEWIQLTLKNGRVEEDIGYFFCLALDANAYTKIILYLLGTIAAVYSFGDVWQKGYWKGLYCCRGKNGFIYGELIFDGAFCIATGFCGFILFILSLMAFCLLSGVPVFTATSSFNEIPSMPVVSLLLRSAVMVISSGWLAMMGISMVLLTKDRFVGCASPILFYEVLEFFFLKYFGVDIGLFSDMFVSDRISNPLIRFGITTTFFVILMYLSGRLSENLMRRRIEHEFVE